MHIFLADTARRICEKTAGPGGLRCNALSNTYDVSHVNDMVTLVSGSNIQSSSFGNARLRYSKGSRYVPLQHPDHLLFLFERLNLEAAPRNALCLAGFEAVCKAAKIARRVSASSYVDGEGLCSTAPRLSASGAAARAPSAWPDCCSHRSLRQVTFLSVCEADGANRHDTSHIIWLYWQKTSFTSHG